MKLRKMSGAGDETVAEWDETTTKEELDKIETEFKALMAKGYFAADLKQNALIKKFDLQTDILMIPRMQGGA